MVVTICQLPGVVCQPAGQMRRHSHETGSCPRGLGALTVNWGKRGAADMTSRMARRLAAAGPVVAAAAMTCGVAAAPVRAHTAAGAAPSAHTVAVARVSQSSPPTIYALVIQPFREAHGAAVLAINTATNKTGPPIKLTGINPQQITITPDGSTVYVLSTTGLTPISTATNTVGRLIPVSGGVEGIVFTPDGSTGYVLSSSGVTPLDTATNTLGRLIPVSNDNDGIAITPDGSTVYVPNYADPSSVTPISTGTNTAGTPISVFDPTSIAFTPNGATAYVVENYANTVRCQVTPIDTSTNKAGTPITVGKGPDAIAITPGGKTAYVANRYSYSVTPIDTATNTAGTPIHVGFVPDAIVIPPGGKTAYVLLFRDALVPINTTTNTTGKHILVAGDADDVGMLLTPDGKTAYVLGYQNRASLWPVTLSTRTSGTPILLGKTVRGFVITP